ncbi:hypothetical protein PMI16_01196 [Herbaspirillum sp. CF444]|nr:hypothetical protein PMI16_01196 [Herbaspirillum sp. CF444]
MTPNEVSVQQVFLFLFMFIDVGGRGLMHEEDFLFPHY